MEELLVSELGGGGNFLAVRVKVGEGDVVVAPIVLGGWSGTGSLPDGTTDVANEPMGGLIVSEGLGCPLIDVAIIVPTRNALLGGKGEG